MTEGHTCDIFEMSREETSKMTESEFDEIFDRPREYWTADEKYGIESYFLQILRRPGAEWTEKERISINHYFFEHRKFKDKGFFYLKEHGISDDAKAEEEVYELRIDLDRKCSFDPNNPKNRGATLIDKFEAFLYNRFSYVCVDFFGKEDAGFGSGSESTETPIGDSGQIRGDIVAADVLNPWEQMQSSEIEAEELRRDMIEKNRKDAERKRQLEVALEVYPALTPVVQAALFPYLFERNENAELKNNRDVKADLRFLIEREHQGLGVDGFDEIVQEEFRKVWGAFRLAKKRGLDIINARLAEEGISPLSLGSDSEKDD